MAVSWLARSGRGRHAAAPASVLIAVLITRIEAHDILADLQRVKKQMAPATLRLLRQLESTYRLMEQHTLADVHMHIKRGSGTTNENSTSSSNSGHRGARRARPAGHGRLGLHPRLH